MGVAVHGDGDGGVPEVDLGLVPARHDRICVSVDAVGCGQMVGFEQLSHRPGEQNVHLREPSVARREERGVVV